ncbi:MAG TPA: methyltransferase domain-containing protein [Thermoanaerobaculia bacterium]|nr:methyltransferase domain-containing protein [Thermoanaerobaculia bacterium]
MKVKLQSDSDEERLEYVLAAQEHCDHFLTPLADPAGKSVLVVGAGAGTEMLWCLRHGAREVLGLDVVPQSETALTAAVAQLGLGTPGNAPRFAIRQLGIEEAGALGRRFDLVLSNNVFEHLPGLATAFAVCARLVEPYRGRIAIFTDPLYYSSAGSHLPVEPWEHLWGEPDAVRERLVSAEAGLGPHHPLRAMDLGTYLVDEISLNRMRLGDFLEAIRQAGLAILNLRLVRDRHLADLARYRERLPGLAEADLAIEGIAAELVRIEGPPPAGLPPFVSTEEVVLAAQSQSREAEVRRLSEALDATERRSFSLASDLEEARRQAGDLRRGLDEVRQVLAAVEASPSFRLGRLATAPLRWLRRLMIR